MKVNNIITFKKFISESAEKAYVFNPAAHTHKTAKGHTFVGHTVSEVGGLKGANVFKHRDTGKYFAAGGSSSAVIKSTTFHDTPIEAAAAYHQRYRQTVS